MKELKPCFKELMEKEEMKTINKQKDHLKKFQMVFLFEDFDASQLGPECTIGLII